MQGYCDIYKWTILKETSPEVKCLHPTSSRRERCTLSVSNVVYHKFSHGAAFYTLSGKNVDVMLESLVMNALELCSHSHILHTHTSGAYKRAYEHVLCPVVFDLAGPQSLGTKQQQMHYLSACCALYAHEHYRSGLHHRRPSATLLSPTATLTPHIPVRDTLATDFLVYYIFFINRWDSCPRLMH